MKVGDKILFTSDMDSPSSITEATITKVHKETIECGGKENQYYKAFAWPLSAKEELVKILQKRQELKKALDDSMSLVYALRNKVSRGELPW
jgi:phosphatidylinositol kinase/protein kinase (PI-3  family)